MDRASRVMFTAREQRRIRSEQRSSGGEVSTISSMNDQPRGLRLKTQTLAGCIRHRYRGRRPEGATSLRRYHSLLRRSFSSPQIHNGSSSSIKVSRDLSRKEQAPNTSSKRKLQTCIDEVNVQGSSPCVSTVFEMS